MTENLDLQEPQEAIEEPVFVKRCYAVLDETGRPTAFYSNDVNEVIPTEAVEITHEQWVEMVSNPGERAFENGNLVTVPLPVAEVSWDDIRQRRDQLLASSDWTQLPDTALTTQQQQQWVDYRIALRNLTETFESPADVEFPVRPM